MNIGPFFLVPLRFNSFESWSIPPIGFLLWLSILIFGQSRLKTIVWIRVFGWNRWKWSASSSFIRRANCVTLVFRKILRNGMNDIPWVWNTKICPFACVCPIRNYTPTPTHTHFRFWAMVHIHSGKPRGIIHLGNRVFFVSPRTKGGRVQVSNTQVKLLVSICFIFFRTVLLGKERKWFWMEKGQNGTQKTILFNSKGVWFTEKRLPNPNRIVHLHIRNDVGPPKTPQ